MSRYVKFLSLLLVFFLLIVWVGCKKTSNDEFLITLSGSGQYNSSIAYLKFSAMCDISPLGNGWIENVNNWKLILKEDSTVVLTITDNNYTNYFPSWAVVTSYQGFGSTNTYSLLILYEGLHSDIYGGKSPNKIELKVTLIDGKGKTHNLSYEVQFTFSRN
jgi:hypothetical protein